MMEFNFAWILLALPLVFALGWFASRLDLRQLRIENRAAPKAYFRGLTHLLNEEQDEAIDAFIEAVQMDPDTSALHFALGDLFRRRGDYERAVRVHEHLLSRGDLPDLERERAQYALGMDFLRAGLLDHAENALQKLAGTGHEEQSRLALLSLYERAHDWDQAEKTAQVLQESGTADFTSRMAHYLCEQAAALPPDDAGVVALYRQAVARAPQAARPRVELARHLGSRGDAGGALDTYLELARHTPQFMPLVAADMVAQARACGRVAEAEECLRRINDEAPSVDLAEARVQADSAENDDPEQARAVYLEHMVHEPSPIAAERWVTSQDFSSEDARAAVRRSLLRAIQPLSRYRCAACGFEASHHFWQCPGCQAWDSFPPRRIEEL